MSSFDPYETWLAIPASEQPANLYRFLNLPLFEVDGAKIDAAARAQAAKVQPHLAGPLASEAKQVLQELAACRALLLDPRRKGSYDVVLKSAAPGVDVDSSANLDVKLPESVKPAPQSIGHGTMIGPYKVLERVSASKLGNVYKVQNVKIGRFFYLKNLPPESVKVDEVRKRFEREIELLTTLSLAHPNVIVGFDRGEFAGGPYLIMEYVLGSDLATLVAQQGPLSPEQAQEYITQVAYGMSQLHKHGVYHRNLKPHVLLLDVQGRVRVTNLLMAKIGDSSPLQHSDDVQLTTAGEQMGSFDFLPPEQALDARKADGRSDIYSMGCTLFYLLTGRPPYVSKKPLDKLMAHQSAPIPLLTELRNDMPVRLEQIYLRMMAKKPDERYQSLEELLTDLEGTAPILMPVKAAPAPKPAPAAAAPSSSAADPVPSKGWFGRLLDKLMGK